jgi:hypothetical protein
MPMHCVYVGDSRDVRRRLTRDHRGGNVEAFAPRRHIAESMAYALTRTKRASGNTRVRIAAPSERSGELRVSEYIRSGCWKHVLCRSYDEASDFQWFVIDRLAPLTNRRREAWQTSELPRYAILLAALEASPCVAGSGLGDVGSGPGVYVLYHDQLPSDA